MSLKSFPEIDEDTMYSIGIWSNRLVAGHSPTIETKGQLENMPHSFKALFGDIVPVHCRLYHSKPDVNASAGYGHDIFSRKELGGYLNDIGSNFGNVIFSSCQEDCTMCYGGKGKAH
eukprot:11517178-Karenia_brevis.AAC.1